MAHPVIALSRVTFHWPDGTGVLGAPASPARSATLRLALARLLLADPPPQLLLLDEPTNSLDIDSIDGLWMRSRPSRARSWS